VKSLLLPRIDHFKVQTQGARLTYSFLLFTLDP
jgi:hypothetical protein